MFLTHFTVLFGTPRSSIFIGFHAYCDRRLRGQEIAFWYTQGIDIEFSKAPIPAPFFRPSFGGRPMTPARTHEALDRNRQTLSREGVLIVAACNTLTVALHRLRRAVYGLDREDRVELAERIAAAHRGGSTRRSKRTTARRTARRAARS